MKTNTLRPPRLFLIDTYGFIFRAYHARARTNAPPMRTSTGIGTEAVYIFHNMLRKMMTSFRPEYMAAIFESGPTFREQSFADYKANRTEMPADLGAQIAWIRKLLEAMRIPMLQYPGFEADDVIGAIARRSEGSGLDVVIVSSDKDMMQLVTSKVSMLNPMKDDTWYDPVKVEQFMGVKPEQVADLLALMGDTIDNIPGAPGIGEKGARDLILQFGSVEAAIERASEVQRKMYRESLQKHREQILLSKKLSSIDTTVPIEWRLEDHAAATPDLAALRSVYRDLEFYSFLKELEAPPDARKTDFVRLEGADDVSAYLNSLPAGLLTGVAFAGGELGISSRTGEGRVIPFEHMELARVYLEDETREKAVHDAKGLMLSLGRLGIAPRGLKHDVMLYSFLLSAEPSASSCETLAERHLDRKLGGGAEARAECALELTSRLLAELESGNLLEVYDLIDRPLVDVLAAMERTGIRIEPAQLQALATRMETDIERLCGEICAIAGREFNINSPQQLGKVLFEEMRLPAPVRYGKGKTISTAADVLEALADDHAIARKVLDYRQLVKLKGTYIDALPALIDPADGRLHTTFNQAGAATGRLSSSNPNLQNIPIRTELSREIRAAFIPREGWRMVVADYSQIELRLLAHMSEDPVLVDSFRRGEDIHTRTAAEVFGVPPLMVTPEMRHNAKAVNFGIVYGQTPFGLATSLGIARAEAELYIAKYFERYAGVRKFIEKTIAEVRARGYALTLFGRRRPIPDMNSRNPAARGFAERTAVNTPLQGTAADLIKLAMIRIHDLLQGRQARMLLQVHDELVFEAPPDEAPALAEEVKSVMERVHKLSVPLVADTGVGANWRNAK